MCSRQEPTMHPSITVCATTVLAEGPFWPGYNRTWHGGRGATLHIPWGYPPNPLPHPGGTKPWLHPSVKDRCVVVVVGSSSWQMNLVGTLPLWALKLSHPGAPTLVPPLSLGPLYCGGWTWLRDNRAWCGTGMQHPLPPPTPSPAPIISLPTWRPQPLSWGGCGGDALIPICPFPEGPTLSLPTPRVLQPWLHPPWLPSPTNPIPWDPLPTLPPWSPKPWLHPLVSIALLLLLWFISTSWQSDLMWDEGTAPSTNPIHWAHHLHHLSPRGSTPWVKDRALVVVDFDSMTNGPGTKPSRIDCCRVNQRINDPQQQLSGAHAAWPRSIYACGQPPVQWRHFTPALELGRSQLDTSTSSNDRTVHLLRDGTRNASTLYPQQ